MKIEHIVKPEQNIVSCTFKVKVEEIPHIIGPTFMKLVKYINENQANILSTPFVSYKNLKKDGTVDGEIVDMEIGFPISDLLNETDDINSYVLPSYKAATTKYTGKYDGLSKVYEKILNDINNVDNEFLGICYEYYLSDEEIPEEQQETIIEILYK